ncbi:MAG: WecB/TagA/CpsF family glycosyltransferase [Verrucomicrobiota bacterium]
MNFASAPLSAESLSPSRTLPTSTQSPEQKAVTTSGPRPVSLLGVPFDNLTISGAVDRIDAMIASRKPHYVVTANVDFLTQAHNDVELRRILLDADLVLCDGTPLVWASRLLGNALPERVAGSDLAPQLIQRAAEKGHRIFLLGAAEGVAAEAATKLKEQHPSLKIVGCYSPRFSALLDMDHEEIGRQVRAAAPDLLLVSFGCPKQEKWIAMHYRSLGVPVAIGVGATIDFMAGRVKRAPDWMRSSGTEWLYRLAQEPRRLYKRYTNDVFHFFPAFARQMLHLSGKRELRNPPASQPCSLPGWRSYDMGVQLTRRALERDPAIWQEIEQSTHNTLLDLSKIRRIDATGIAFLARYAKLLHASRRHLVLLAPSRAVLRAFATLNLTDHFHLAENQEQVEREAATLNSQASVQHDGTLRSLVWSGEIVASNAETVWQTTVEHLQAFVTKETALIAVDLSQLRFIDSSGAAIMLRLKKWAKAQQTELLFANPQPNVRNVLRLTRLDQLLLEGGQ